MYKTQVYPEREIRRALIQAYTMLRLYNADEQLISRVYLLSVNILYGPIKHKVYNDEEI